MGARDEAKLAASEAVSGEAAVPKVTKKFSQFVLGFSSRIYK